MTHGQLFLIGDLTDQEAVDVKLIIVILSGTHSPNTVWLLLYLFINLFLDDVESATRDTNVSDVEKLKSVVQQLSNERSSTVGISVIESQGMW